MRNKKIAAYICMGLLLMTAGCGNSDSDSYVSKANTINFNDEDIEKNSSNDQTDEDVEKNSSNSQTDEDTEKNSSNSQTGEESANNQQSNEENNNLQENYNNQPESSQTENENDYQSANEDSTLDGNIVSIESNSVIINKTFNLSSTTAVAYGGNDAVYVTVYFSEETTYEVWTVKNSGINGDSDIDKQEGAFSDIKEQLSVKLTGHYEGENFYAAQVIIYNFV